MGKYQKPKKKLHREFAYLNYDSIVNALSAFEAGQVDSIIEKTSEASDGGVSGGLKVGPAKADASKKKKSSVQEELVRTRTRFSAFDAWLSTLEGQDAIGEFDVWDMTVRDDLEIGDLIRFAADLRLSPVHKLFAAYASFASSTTNGNIFQVSGSQAAEIKKTARMMETWISGRDGTRSYPAYFCPNGTDMPRIIGRLTDSWLISGLDSIEERYTVIGQVRSKLEGSDRESVIRLLRNAPAFDKEIETVKEAMQHFIEPGEELGVPVDEQDLTFRNPDVILHPIAIFK